MFSSWPIRTVETERRRLEALRYLASTPGYRAAQPIVRDHLRRIGIPSSDDQVADCAAWLAEHDLVRIEAGMAGAILRITRRGQDIGLGFATHPGISPPDP